MGSGLLHVLKDPFLLGVNKKAPEKIEGEIESFWYQTSEHNGNQIPWTYVKIKDQTIYLALIGEDHMLENGRKISAEGFIEEFENPTEKVLKAKKYHTKKPGFLFGRNLEREFEFYSK